MWLADLRPAADDGTIEGLRDEIATIANEAASRSIEDVPALRREAQVKREQKIGSEYAVGPQGETLRLRLEDYEIGEFRLAGKSASDGKRIEATVRHDAGDIVWIHPEKGSENDPGFATIREGLMRGTKRLEEIAELTDGAALDRLARETQQDRGPFARHERPLQGRGRETASERETHGWTR